MFSFYLNASTIIIEITKESQHEHRAFTFFCLNYSPTRAASHGIQQLATESCMLGKQVSQVTLAFVFKRS